MKTKHTAPPPRELAEAEIQQAAYFLWLEQGCPGNHELDHWLTAQEQFRQRHGRVVHPHVHFPPTYAAMHPTLTDLERASIDQEQR